MKAKKWILDNIPFMDRNTLLRVKINGSENSLDEINFVISSFMDIERDYKIKHILNKEIFKINNTRKDMLEIIVI